MQREARGVDAETALEIVKRGHRALSLERHPDRGGDHEGMLRSTRAKEWLLGAIGRVLPPAGGEGL